MTAPHFFVDSRDHPRLAAGSRVRLSREDSHHALRSLRLRNGEAVTVADGVGAFARGQLGGEVDGLAVIDVREVADLPSPRPRFGVALAPPKGDRLWWAVQKLGELGVDDLYLVRTARTAAATDDSIRKRLGRAQAIAREAAMQSRRPFIMNVSDRTLDELLGQSFELQVLLHEAAEIPVRDALTTAPPDSVLLAVGPEGGFTDEEVEGAERAGIPTASLGSGILRTETAAVVGAALVLHRYGRLG